MSTTRRAGKDHDDQRVSLLEKLDYSLVPLPRARHERHLTAVVPRVRFNSVCREKELHCGLMPATCRNALSPKHRNSRPQLAAARASCD